MKWLKDRFKYALQGFVCCLNDNSIRLQMIFGLVVILLSFLFHCTMQEWCWILLCITLVIVSEIFNSCIEKTVDYISTDRSQQAKQIKDMAACAVFLSSCFAFIMGLYIFVPKLWEVIYGL